MSCGTDVSWYSGGAEAEVDGKTYILCDDCIEGIIARVVEARGLMHPSV